MHSRINLHSWYAAGLSFTCRGCHRCCHIRGQNQWVFISGQEADEMARLLRLTPAAFRSRYCTTRNMRLALSFAGPRCPLHDGQGCSVYPARPVQCRSWPFWPENLYSAQAWQREVASFCPGVGGEQRWSADEIHAILHGHFRWRKR